MEKTSIYLAGISNSNRQEIENNFSFTIASLPVRYLGLPLMTKRISSSDYYPLIERIHHRITKWSVRFLSFARRLQLITSVLSVITHFWSATFRLPRKCLRDINQLCSDFLWSGPDLNSRKAKISWEQVCLPKKEGGWGSEL